MKYTVCEIARISAGTLLTGSFDTAMTIGSVFTDSRSFSAGPGGMFIAISGRNHDGHAYINELYARGVRAFMVERDIATEKYADAAFVLVESSVAALQAVAADHRSRFKGVMVGITGSNGKTMVKEWIASLIPPGIKVFRSPKSYNSQIGVPLSVLMIKGDEQVALIEAGISEPGEMERLEKIIRPDVGVITTIGDAHQENFASVDEKLAEKLLLFKNTPRIIYHSAYGQVKEALGEKYPDAELVDASLNHEPDDVFSDRASRENAATAVAVCDLLGYPHRQTVERLVSLHPVAMRLELREGINNSVIIDDSYNSDINSLAIALDYLAGAAGGRGQTLVLSDILQSGYPEAELYAKVAAMVGRSQVDSFVGIGGRIGRYRHLFTMRSRFHPTPESWLATLKSSDITGRAILLKGNRTFNFTTKSIL